MIKNIITLNFASGYKTYTASVIGIILTGLLATGYIEQATFNVVASFFGFFGLASLRKAKG